MKIAKSFLQFLQELLKPNQLIIYLYTTPKISETKDQIEIPSEKILFGSIPADNPDTIMFIDLLKTNRAYYINWFDGFINKIEKKIYISSNLPKEKQYMLFRPLFDACKKLNIKYVENFWAHENPCLWCWRRKPCPNFLRNLFAETGKARPCLTEKETQVGWYRQWEEYQEVAMIYYAQDPDVKNIRATHFCKQDVSVNTFLSQAHFQLLEQQTIKKYNIKEVNLNDRTQS